MKNVLHNYKINIKINKIRMQSFKYLTCQSLYILHEIYIYIYILLSERAK